MSAPALTQYWVVEGPIGAGKTTLARSLAMASQARQLLEKPEDNLFLPRFYRDPVSGALPAQLGFLLQRAGQCESFVERDLFDDRWVADFLFDKDRLFANLTLSAVDLDVYDRVFQRLAWHVPAPTAVIYLTGPVEVLMERIARRGREYEASISASYLTDLNLAYAQFFNQYRAAPVLEVDISKVDFFQDPDRMAELHRWLLKPSGYSRMPDSALL